MLHDWLVWGSSLPWGLTGWSRQVHADSLPDWLLRAIVLSPTLLGLAMHVLQPQDLQPGQLGLSELQSAANVAMLWLDYLTVSGWDLSLNPLSSSQVRLHMLHRNLW